MNNDLTFKRMSIWVVGIFIAMASLLLLVYFGGYFFENRNSKELIESNFQKEIVDKMFDSTLNNGKTKVAEIKTQIQSRDTIYIKEINKLQTIKESYEKVHISNNPNFTIDSIVLFFTNRYGN